MTLSPGGGTYLLFNKQTGQAVGIPNGYSRVGIRHTLFEDGPQQVFGEAHALITDTSRYGFNAGVGYRQMIDDALWGVNGWYDTLESPQSFNYQQAGVGVEYLSDQLDLRANGYIPFGNRENFLNVTDPGTTPIFVGNNFSSLGTALFQQALEGFDAEAGIPVPVINWLRMYAGFYRLNFENDETWGVRSRIEGKLTQGVNLSFQVTNDDKFGTNLNVGVDIRFDGRLPTRFGASNDAFSRRYDQVRRQWQVQLAQTEGAFAVPLNDPATGRQIGVTWVNNNAAPGGDGTFERPFRVLPSSANSDYVLVKRGTGDTIGNITLRNGQDLFGEGKPHSIETDRLGLTPIPSSFFANTGSLPTLRGLNPDAPVVTLADGNIVSAFNITGGTTAAIAGTGTDNFLVECVNVTSASGLSIVDGGGTGIIRQSTFFNTSPTGVGVSVTNTAGPALNLLVDDVTTQGGAVGTSVRANGAPVNVTLTNYLGSDHTNAGVILGANGSTLTANVNNADLTNGGDGFRFDVVGGGTLSGSVTDISATGSGNLLEGNVNTGRLDLAVTDARLSNSTGGSGVALNLTQATGVAVFDNLTANGNAVDGVNSVASGAATNYQLEVHDSSLVGNTDDAVDSTVLAGANMLVIVDPTPATGSGDNGYEFEADGPASRLTALMTDTDYSNSGNDGVNGLVTDGARVDIVFDRSPATDSGRHGLNVVVDNGSILMGLFRDGSFARSGVGNNGIGINVDVTNNSLAGLTFENTDADSNGAIGFAYDVAGGSRLSATFTDGNLSSNPLNNVLGTVDGPGSVATLVFNNTLANLQAVNGGFVSSVTNGAHLDSTWNNNSNIFGTLGDGVRVVGTGNATQIDLTFNNSMINNNAGNGILASLTGGNAASSLDITLNDSTLLRNQMDGLHVLVDGVGTTGNVVLNSTPVSKNTLDGFEYDVTGGALFTTTVAGAGNDFSDNGDNGIDGSVSGTGSRAIVTVDAANVDNSGNSGVLLRADQRGNNQFTLSNASVLGSGIHGVDAVASTNGQLAVNLTTVNIQQSQQNGFTFDALTGGDVTGTVATSNLSNNGLGGTFSGVRGNVNGVGSTANVSFNDSVANTNTLHGFQLNSSGGGLLTATLNSSTAGALSANGNTGGDGIQLGANGAGSIANLLMFGESTLNGNFGNGLRVTGVDAQQVAVQFSGSADANGADGINVSLNNVTNAAVELSTVGGGTIQNNVGDGIEIDLVDTDLTDLTVNGTLVEALRIEGLSILTNGGDGINIQADNSDLTSGLITGNTIAGNGGDSLVVNLTNGSDWDLDITSNMIVDATGNGLVVTADSGTSIITISDNTVAGSLLDNILVDLSGTANVELHIDRNIVDGDGLAPTVTANIVQSFLSPVDDALANGEPPDAMGAVGPNHVVELVNDNFRIYDKATGVLLSGTTDEEFWQNVAGANLFGSDVFRHRIIFDPTTNRWIATTITQGAGNQILLAVSDTSDPTGGWRSVQWVGDPTGVNFNDFDTLGFDGDAVVISTVDFGGGFLPTVSVFSIPKADLFGVGAPSIAQMTRIQGLTPATAGTALQAALDFGPSDGQTAILAVDDTLVTSTQILRTNILGGTGPGATLSAATPIAVPSFNVPANVQTPNGTTVRANSDRFWGNTVEVNDELWAVHHVAGAGGLNELRWYRIDEATNALISTGTIAAPGLSLFMPSIAVNPAGEIVIGYHAGGGATAPSAYASAGVVRGNNVFFGAPTLLTAGTGEYGGFRWGEYSATVVDPSDPNRFWTILETSRGVTDGITDFEYGEAFNSIDVNSTPGSTQLTTGHGIHVIARDSATIGLGSTINDNSVSGNGLDGIHVDLIDTSVTESLSIDGNTSVDNGGDGIEVATAGTPTINQLTVSDNLDVSNNGGAGILVDLTDVVGLQDLAINGNSVARNQGGILVNINNTVPAVAPIQVDISDNTVSGNTGFGIDANFNNVDMSLLNVRNNVSGTNTNDGLRITANSSPITLAEISDNRLLGNLGNEGMFLTFTDSPLGTLSVKRNIIGGAIIDGMRIDLDNSPVGSLEIVSNNLGGGGGTATIIDDSLPVIRPGFNGNTLPSNDDGSTGAIPLGFTADFFGQIFNNAFVNNNGNITFGASLSTFTPFGLLNTNRQIIAPFFADVDTREAGAVVTPDVTYGPGVVAGRPAFGVDWIDVRHFSVGGANAGLPANTFQLVLIDRSDVAAGDFDIEFNYGQILWEAGTASGSNQFGLGGTSATVGYSNGINAAVEFPGSRVNGSLLDSGPAATSLIQNSLNSANAGRYVFFARSGNVGTTGGGSGGDGLALNISNGSDISEMLIDQNLIVNNGFHGIDINVTDSTLPTTSVISENTITGQGGSGISLIDPDTNGTSFGIDFLNNVVSDNAGGPGIDIQLNDNAGGVVTTQFVGNTLDNNGMEGINLALTENITSTTTDFSGNTVSNNDGIGFHVDATDNSQFSLDMGATGHNTFEANTEAGLAVTMNDTTQGQLTIADSQFDNTTNGLNALFGGEGINIQLADNASLSNLTIGDPVLAASTASENASHGVQILVADFSQLTSPTIQGLTMNDNGGDGINVERRGLGVIDNFVISGNVITSSGSDGLELQARGGNLTDEYTLSNNTIDGSTGRGIAFLLEGDADMTTDLDGNTITANGGDGIFVNSTVNAVTESPIFTGTWLASTITGNTGRGVDIQSPGHIIQIGDATAAFPDTIISNNIQEGVFVNSLGTLDLDNVQINGNGAGGVLFNGGTGGLMTIDRAEISGNTGHGVDLVMNGNTLSVTNSRIASNTLDGVRVQSLAGVNDVTLTNNVMTLNTQDGLEIINDSAAGFTATITNSQFNNNTERGVAIFNRANGQANVTFDDNQANSNQEEGVYIVNTADADQNTRANATVAMENGGLVNATPDLIFAMNRNTVSANGLGSAFQATGLVMRVGTADGGLFDHTDNGGFADTRAGVTATVQDNILQGNAGSDVFFQSFVSTVNPLNSQGTWDAATFNLTEYETDPLARLDLFYGNNQADATEATTIGAAYTNDEDFFKSRLATLNPAGPFASGNRLRNAQRVSDRDVAPGGLLLDPNAPVVQPDYLFPGMGDSTFRVRLDAGNIFGTGTGFIRDANTPINDINDHRGVGALPELFGWGTLP